MSIKWGEKEVRKCDILGDVNFVSTEMKSLTGCRKIERSFRNFCLIFWQPNYKAIKVDKFESVIKMIRKHENEILNFFKNGMTSRLRLKI